MKKLTYIGLMIYFLSLSTIACTQLDDHQSAKNPGENQDLKQEVNSEQQITYYANDLGVKIVHPSSITIRQIGMAHSAYNPQNQCLTTIEFATAPKSWEPPYFKILESTVEGQKEEYNLPGIVDINTIDEQENLSIFYGELSFSPVFNKVLQVRTSNLKCQDLHLAILRGLSAM